jgi:O-6-methylguanine DNA methyltransferase
MRIIKLEMEEEEHRPAVDEVFPSPSAKHPSKVVQSNKQNMKKITSRQASFSERVYAIVAKIPIGKVMTYKQVAAKAGSPHAARAVGNLMKNNYNPKIPCHRVVRSDGKIGDYNRGGSERKMVARTRTLRASR